MQPALFSVPPVNGNTRESREASRSGARHAVITWTARQSAYLQLLNTAGALTDQDAAKLLPYPLSSINSVRCGLEKRAKHRGESPMFVPDGYDLHVWVDGQGREHVTKRTRWKLAR